MKKIISVLLVLLMLMALTACGKKEKAQAAPAAAEPVAAETPAADPAEAVEYTVEYWEKEYPGENVCPFYISIDGVEYSYYRVSGLDEGTMYTWINTPLNWNGWHLVGEDIVNKEETFRMTADWAAKEPAQAFSSSCVVTTEPYTPAGK